MAGGRGLYRSGRAVRRDGCLLLRVFWQAGCLDHALASSSMAGQVTDATIWHINADEPSVLDYNTEFKSAGQVISLCAADEYRCSDHDPVIVDLELESERVYLPIVLRTYL